MLLTIGFVITLGDCPINFASKHQTEIALSTFEAEYIALATAMRELIPLRRAFVEMASPFNLASKDNPVVKSKVFEDNNGCISTCRAPRMTLRTKYIAVKYHFFIRNYLNLDHTVKREHNYELLKIESEEQKADLILS